MAKCCNKLALVLVTVFVSVLQYVESSRILLLTPQGGSHVIEIQRLGASLVKRGHKVYVALQDMLPLPEIYPGIEPLWYQGSDKLDRWKSASTSKALVSVAFDAKRPAFSCPRCDEYTANECDSMLHDKKFMANVEKLHFDLAIVDFIIFSPCNALVAHHFRIPYVYFSSNTIGWRARDPAWPCFVTTFFTTLSDRMTFVERLQNTVQMVYHELYYFFTTADDHLFNEFASDLGTWNELIRKSQFFIVLDDPISGWPTPTLPNVVRIPTMGSVPVSPLEGEIANLVRSAKNGVIVASFGALVSDMPASTVETFVSAFGRVKQMVIWRTDAKNNAALRHLPANVHVFPWLPQRELLADSATRVFITHAGSNGYQEALYHGVPMIAFPLFADQPHYAFRIAYHQYGIQMQLHSFTVDELVNNINTVLNDPSYRERTTKASAILKSRPMTGVQTATYWVEHILKFGGKHLRSYAQDMPWYQFYMVDIFLAFTILVYALLYTALTIGKFVFRLSARKLKSKKQNKID